ncbi:MAG TPA: hypothetical protein VN843_26735, partial [Anaerolineales bacterium]|nr:hypothetical protein [Anaerolineales bacterium]
VGVLLWGDIQIRMTVIRPTYPVMAFEAPGALGCDEPVEIVRRSDSQSGWEYAEVHNHAVAIQRLFGYDGQKVSAPFLDQSNINLAYSYSEQPMVYESQANIAARCIASASLVRPVPFDAANEFSGIKVEIEYPEIFRVALPDGSLALIAPGETMPKRATVNGLEVEGVHMRYVQASKDLNEMSGLGLTQIAGLANFDEPATFRIKRSSKNTVNVTTNTGFKLTDQWMKEPVRCIEARMLDNQWLDVTSQCQGASIPPPVVEEWSERNQRTLVEFRINV